MTNTLINHFEIKSDVWAKKSMNKNEQNSHAECHQQGEPGNHQNFGKPVIQESVESWKYPKMK
jgi:hypothetical protein